MQRELEERVLSLTPREILANNCPRCFGPPVEGKRASEPSYIVCVDGNFQHKRHSAASKEYSKRKHVTPHLFMESDRLEHWGKFYELSDANAGQQRRSDKVVRDLLNSKQSIRSIRILSYTNNVKWNLGHLY